jgi:ribonuclease PH
MKRNDGRRPDELRPLVFEVDYLEQPHGSVLVSQGKTKVLCTAMIAEEVPRWLRNQGRGWMTAEYSLLPASTGDRVDREASRGKQQGRTIEIQRLIGRALRGVVDFRALGERTMWLDCDVLQADGGTRTAAITGAYVALADAVTYLSAAGRLSDPRPLSCAIAAVSVGVVDGRIRVDLPYSEDSRAEVDMNVVATDTGTLVEIQGTGEGATFPRSTLDKMLDAAMTACEQLFALQREALELPYPGVLPESAEPAKKAFGS